MTTDRIIPQLAAEAQKLATSPYVVLFRLDATNVGAGVIHFLKGSADSTPVSFGGQLYMPFDLQTEGFEWSGTGRLPTPNIRVANVNRDFSALVGSYDDLLGATLIRIRTFERFLDGRPEADSSAHFPIDHYRIERKVKHTKTMVEWELSAAMDQEGRLLPGRHILRDACTHAYRVWTGSSFDYGRATCPYTGGKYFRPNGQTTDIAADDRCGKRLSDCKARFGATEVLPTRAFPGVARLRT